MAFLSGVSSTVNRLSATFTEDIASFPEDGQAVGHRILDRADVVQANIADELALLNDSAQGGDAWWRERVSNGREIVASTEELAADMVGFLETGTVPSEVRRRTKRMVLGGIVAAVAGIGGFLWWKRQGVESHGSSIQGCGCSIS